MADSERIRVAVTSQNKEKLSAVEIAFKSRFTGGATVEVVACPADSGIPHGQPWGMQHTYEGALARLSNLKAAGPVDARYLVSAENGVCGLLRHDSTEGLDVACVVVERVSDGRQAMNFSQGRPYPLAKVQELNRAGTSNGEIGSFCKRWYEEQNLPLSRFDQISSATMLALAMLGPEA
eukprot:gb/GFBE01038687.1/.p1 GENE.gb/GFBE01038687.1/~~gb/GFBE01038687.1/.p1  ORF type:complete len:179 (+),score=38.16 gb/GFBE01038687.1/:1-537(+)